ncbi:MAG: hypothetical protein GY778_05325 [bacterium]|nr:hypothetical protein [bacterium]
MAVGFARTADMTFRTGPGMQAGQAATVLVGRVSDYRQEVTRQSPPQGGEPVEWTVSGRLGDGRVLKGVRPARPVPFERAERAPWLSPGVSPSSWQRSYGNLADKGQAVMFLGKGQEPPVLTVVPTGDGERDLAGLVADIVRFRVLPKSEDKYRAWTGYLAQSRTDEGKRAALRALCYSSAKWERLERPCGMLLANRRVNPPVRVYAFAIVAYYVGRERWDEQTNQAVDFLGGVFVREPDPDLTMQYLVSLSVILDQCNEEGYHQERRPVRDQIHGFLKRRRKLVIRGSPAVEVELEEDYRETREEMLAGPPAEIPADEP